MIIQNPGFAQAVKERSLLPAEEIDLLLGRKGDGLNLLRSLLAQWLVSYQEAGQLWADGFGVGWIDLEATIFQDEVVNLLPQDFARKHNIILVYQMKNRQTALERSEEPVTAAMADPDNELVRREAEQLIGRPLSIVCALPEQIQNAIDVQYQSIEALTGASKQVVKLAASRKIGKVELEKITKSESVVELVRIVFLLALKEGASDIHVESFEAHTSIRFRIDGILMERARLAPEISIPFVSRIKVISRMDITERRRPQDGRMMFEMNEGNIDIRVSVVPSIYGENVALRLLGSLRRREVPELEEMGFAKDIHEHIRHIISSPNGIIFITGPTGSGKTTTLFSLLKRINSQEKKIITLEDPVEYRLPGITQIQMNNAINLTFANSLPSILRQDPDAILIGEIRDLETARIATEAALTGHLVLSTLHTNNAIQAMNRMVEIGVEPFLVGPSLIGIISQRLVRRICDGCKESYTLNHEEMENLFTCDEEMETTFYRGKGCPACNMTGYHGRIAVHELVIVTEDVRQMIMDKESPQIILQAAIKKGYRSMRYDGIKKVLRGLTTLEEIDRVVPRE